MDLHDMYFQDARAQYAFAEDEKFRDVVCSWLTVERGVRENGGKRFRPHDNHKAPWKQDIYGHVPRFVDHRYSYIDKTGKKVYVAEPYGLTDDDLEAILSYADDWRIDIHASGWWSPGHTVRIEFRAKEATT